MFVCHVWLLLFFCIMATDAPVFAMAFAGKTCTRENAGWYWDDIKEACKGALGVDFEVAVWYPDQMLEEKGRPTPMWGRQDVCIMGGRA